MACVVYDRGNVYIINHSSSSSGGELQYFTLSVGLSSDVSGTAENSPSPSLKARAPSTPVPLRFSPTVTFVPNGKCGYYNSHLYMIGIATSSSNETAPAIADINISGLTGAHTITPLPTTYINVNSVAKVAQRTSDDCLALAEAGGIRIFCTGGSGNEAGVIDMKNQTVNNILSYSSDTHLLVLLENRLAFDYNINSTDYLRTVETLGATPSSQRLPTGSIIPYRSSNGTYEALLVSGGNQPTVTLISKSETSMNYTTLTVPTDITSGIDYYLTVDTSDTVNPPIYAVTMQSENDFAMNIFTLDNFVASSIPPDDNNGSGPAISNSDSASSNTGAIAGGVVGGVVGLALILGLLIFFLRKRRKSRQPEFESIGEKSQSSTAAWNFKTSSIKQIPEPQTHIRNLNVSPAELEALEPTSALAGGAVVLLGAYQLTRDPPVFADETHNRVPKYATRGIVQQSNGQHYTLHYFTQATQGAFLQSVNTTCAIDSPRVIQHHDAIALNQSTQLSGYRYLWITAPCDPNHSLHNALSGNDKNVDLNDYPFKAWSTYALLEAVKDIHAANYVHLGLTPSCFFYADPEDSISDWQVTGFDQAHTAGERITEARLNQWSAPELFSTASSDNRRCFRQTVQTASDIWSLGCIIYTLATGRNLTIDLNHTAELSRRDRDQLYIRVTSACNEAGTINESYRTLLEGMLQPDPSRRSTAEHLAAYWKEANGLYDDNEEENNEAEESIVSP